MGLRITARELHSQHECAAEDAGPAGEKIDQQRNTDQELPVANTNGRGSGRVRQESAQDRNDEGVRSVVNKTRDIVAKSSVNKAGTEDFVLAENDEEEPGMRKVF